MQTSSDLAIMLANLVTSVPWNEREKVNVANMQTTLQRLKETAEGAAGP